MSDRTLTVDGKTITLSHPDKVLFATIAPASFPRRAVPHLNVMDAAIRRRR